MRHKPITFNRCLLIVKSMLIELNDNMRMELILGYFCFGLLIAIIGVVRSDPSEEKPTNQEK